MAYRTIDCVKQVTTSTGDGDMVLGAAVTGFQSFSAALSSGDTFAYEIHAEDVSGVRGVTWEVGYGQYVLDGATHILRRLIKISGSDGEPEFTVFSSGRKVASITASSSVFVQSRLFMADTPVFYVRADGDNGNTGLANTSVGAFASLAGALSAVNGVFSNATINLGAGVFSGGSVFGGEVTITGAGIADTTIGHLNASGGATVFMSSLTVGDGINTDVGVLASGPETYVSIGTVGLDDCPEGHLKSEYGARIEVGACTVSAGCSAGPHAASELGGMVYFYGVVTVSDDISVTGGWASCARGLGVIEYDGATFSLGGNTVTGTRYNINLNGICNTHGGGASFLPGSSAGSTASGGQYL